MIGLESEDSHSKISFTGVQLIVSTNTAVPTSDTVLIGALKVFSYRPVQTIRCLVTPHITGYLFSSCQNRLFPVCSKVAARFSFNPPRVSSVVSGFRLKRPKQEGARASSQECVIPMQNLWQQPTQVIKTSGHCILHSLCQSVILFLQ